MINTCPCNTFVNIPLPKKEGNYDLIAIDSCLRYRHGGFITPNKIVFSEGLCYQVSPPEHRVSITKSINKEQLLNGLKQLVSAIKWLQSQQIFISKLDETNIFVNKKEEKIEVVAFLGSDLTKTPSNALEQLRSFFDLEQSWIDEQPMTEGTVVYDYREDDYPTLISPHRDQLKILINRLVVNYSYFSVEHFYLTIDLYQRSSLMVSDIETLTDIGEIVISIVVNNFYQPNPIIDYQGLERYLLVQNSGIFFNPVFRRGITNANAVKYLTWICLNVEPTTYYLADLTKFPDTPGENQKIGEVFKVTK